MIWNLLALGCGLYLIIRLDLWYYSLPKAERDENRSDMWVW
jgi:hypothetical protein